MKLHNLDLLDYITLISSTRGKIQKVRGLSTKSKGIGLNINFEKTILLRLNTPNNMCRQMIKTLKGGCKHTKDRWSKKSPRI